MTANDEKTRVQVTLSAPLRKYLERQAELRGLPLSTVITHFLADRMLADSSDSNDDS